MTRPPTRPTFARVRAYTRMRTHYAQLGVTDTFTDTCAYTHARALCASDRHRHVLSLKREKKSCRRPVRTIGGVGLLGRPTTLVVQYD
jgi:hypothetical protein